MWLIDTHPGLPNRETVDFRIILAAFNWTYVYQGKRSTLSLDANTFYAAVMDDQLTDSKHRLIRYKPWRKMDVLQ